jgi:Na+-transporting NADH:ubiquinone oxidoreductase subunit NqrB
MTLERTYSKDLMNLSLTSAFITTQIGVALYFWPVTVVVGSLFLTVAFYILLGLGQAKLDGRLFASTIKEHLIVGIFIFIAMFFATHWGA